MLSTHPCYVTCHLSTKHHRYVVYRNLYNVSCSEVNWGMVMDRFINSLHVAVKGGEAMLAMMSSHVR